MIFCGLKKKREGIQNEKIILSLVLCSSVFLIACTNSNKTGTLQVNRNKIEVSATTEELEDLATKDVEDTIQSLDTERNTLTEKIVDYNSYLANTNEIQAFYEKVVKTTNQLGIRLRSYAYKYADLILNNQESYANKYKDLSGIYNYIYEDAGKDMYDIYDDLLSEMYDHYYDGILSDAYDQIDDLNYEQWYNTRSDAYDDWSDCRSDVYDLYTDTLSDIYEFGSDVRSQVYDENQGRAKKIMTKFEKQILHLEEDAKED